VATKRTVTILLVAALALTPAACGSKRKKTSSPDPAATQQTASTQQAVKAGDVIYIAGWKPSNELNDQALIEQKLYDASVWVIPSDYGFNRSVAKGDKTVKAIYRGEPGNELTIMELPAGIKVGYDHDLCVSPDELKISIDPALLGRLTADKAAASPKLWENNVKPADVDDCTAQQTPNAGVVPVPGASTTAKRPPAKPSITKTPASTKSPTKTASRSA
jgi:hypothetical protein